MNGKRYYLTTLGAWRSQLSRCAEVHFVILDRFSEEGSVAFGGSRSSSVADDETPILALISADEAAHIAFENDANTDPLPHPLSRIPVSALAVAALAHLGVETGDDTFTVAEKLARVNPLLRHRVF